VLAAAGPSPLWYLTRATGAVALLLLTASVVLGILGAVRFGSPRWPRFLTAGLHRNLSLLVLALLAVHILTAVLDSFAPIGLKDAVVPFVSAYRPLWLGLGALAFDLLLALAATSLLRRRLGYRAWRSVHWLAYGSWPLALTHGLGTGSDAKVGWMLGSRRRLPHRRPRSAVVAARPRLAGSAGRASQRSRRQPRSPTRDRRLV
jgi:methionine sulfoxide reductase heme-binding subunit